MSYNSNPKRYTFSVGKYGVEVDVSKWDCKREPAHCHVTYNGRRIGQVWLSSNRFEDIPSIMSNREVNEVLDEISRQSYYLEETYRYNAENGAD